MTTELFVFASESKADELLPPQDRRLCDVVTWPGHELSLTGSHFFRVHLDKQLTQGQQEYYKRLADDPQKVFVFDLKSKSPAPEKKTSSELSDCPYPVNQCKEINPDCPFHENVRAL